MAGSVLAVGVVACTAVLAVGLATAGAAAVHGQRLADAADVAALAAADTASGAASGDPCARAAQLAELAGARLAECVVDGLVATVAVSGAFAGIPASARARAGPPPAEP